MSQATVRFDLGAESVTVPLDITLPTGGVPLVGDVSGTFGDCFVAGDLNLTGNLFIEGLMTGIDTFHVQGNGFTIFFQNGGRADLHGKVKAAWGPWGTDTTGWVAGDRLGVAATKAGIYVPSELAWSDWSMTRPTNSPDVTLSDGRIVKPEVVNLSQSIVFENLARGFHFHDSAGVQMMSDVKFLNCGTAGVLGSYPVHFHLNGDNTRGSVLERVVVEGGRNHAFVPHGSHGISFPGCVAYNTTGVAYWWDKPAGNPANNSHDIHWDDCLSMWSKSSTMPGENTGLSGFQLGAGTGCTCKGSVATCIPASGNNQRSGFLWAENANLKPWDFRDCLAHNCGDNGIFTWQNTDELHFIEDFVAYNCGDAGVSHGAYVNQYRYSRMVLSNCGFAVKQNAKTRQNQPNRLLFEDIVTDGHLWVAHHNSDHMLPTIYRRCSFTSVLYQGETENGSLNQYEDCGLVPSDFNFSGASPATIAEIYEGGVLMHRWQSGVWS